MFVRKQNLEVMQKLLDELNGRVRNQNIEFAKLKDANDELLQELEDSRDNLKALSEQLNFLNEAFKQLNNELREELAEMKLFFSNSKKTLISDLSSEFSTEMQNNTKKIYEDLEEFKNLKSTMSGLNNDAHDMKIEILKFLDIASRIKEADFNLEKYSKILEQNDREKVELLKRIDALERLIAKNRKNTL